MTSNGRMLNFLEYAPDELTAQIEAIKARQPIKLSKPYYGFTCSGIYYWITDVSTKNPKRMESRFPSPTHLFLTAFENGKQVKNFVAVYRLKSID